jgi:integral membrane protein (TIGR00529 family)
MVKEATEGTEMSQEEKAFSNYWFRHPWEYVLPLYPGVVFASAVSGIPLNTLLIANVIGAAMVVVTGFIFSMRGVNDAVYPGGEKKNEHAKYRSRKKGLLSFLPIGAVLILVLIVRAELHYALIAVLIPLLYLYRYGPAQILKAVRYGFSPDVLVMIAGIMLFKETMEASGAVKNLSSLLIEHGVPSAPIFCLLPMVAGILTGHTVGFVGSTVPLLISMADQASLPLISLAFASGFVGVLLSPVHLCLILTKEYFHADLQDIYKMTLPAGMIMLAAVLAQYFALK